MRIYAARNKNTGKLVGNITRPGHKFWMRKNDCEAAISKYNNDRYRRKDYDLELVIFELVEVNDTGE